MDRSILVIVEQWQGQVDNITYQMLTKGRQLADSLGGGLSALILGHGLDCAVETLKDTGIDDLLVMDDPALALAGPEVQAEIIARAAKKINPSIVLMGYSLIGMELAPSVAACLGVPAMTNCVNVEVEAGKFVVTRPLFDGTLHARIALEGPGPAVVGLQRGTTPTEILPAKGAAVERLSLDIQAIPKRCEVLEFLEEAACDVDIGKAELLVSVGRGIGDREKIPLIEELAEALGGLVACSRPLVDLGFLPRERQVGASGKIVAPKVYIACGISGASQHLTGMSDAKMIVAINKDPNAPIFQVAHYGVLADMFGIVPALTEAARAAGCDEAS